MKTGKTMITAWTIWIALLLPLSGCGGEKPEETKEEAGPSGKSAGEAPGTAGKHAEAGEGVLAVNAEVLQSSQLTTFAATLRPGGEGITALGELKVDEGAYAEVGPPIPARIVRLLAAPGQWVRRGQPLAALQSVELGQARARRTGARARSDLARQTAGRKRGLAAERIVSGGELQRAEADLAEAEAELRAAEAAVSALGVAVRPGGDDLSGFSLLAPLSGTVLERAAVQGQMTDPSRPLFRIADLSRLWLVAQAPERDASRVREGAPVEIALAALPGQKLQGTVAWVGREVDAHSRTVPVRILLPNEGGRLKPGMFATVWIGTGGAGEKVVAVPAAALQRMDGQWAVFLPRGQGRFEVRPVERGRDLGDQVAIVSGLRPGERVVVEGAFLLRAEAEKREGGGEHHHD
jgi:cobalt-zinc-cadmium efflux system membrane fusion protein